MAAASSISFCRPIPALSSSLSTPILISPFPKPPSSSSSSSSSACASLRLGRFPRTRKLRPLVVAAAAAELGEAESAVPQPEGDEASPAATPDQTVSVTVSPSDVLTMSFQAEGSISETAIPTVTKALEETEGVSDLRVQVAEGIGTVQLRKQTTVQATGVASNLVELIQSKGFKLQTLNLSFQDEEDLS